MQCRNCKCEIPPAFVTAIANNSCPGCGKEIMSETDQELMTSLSEAMERMPNDPQGLAGWLLSNYRLTKVGAAEPVERFYRPVQGRVDNSGEPGNNFFERAGVKPNTDIKDKINKLKQNKQMAPLAEAMQSNFENDDEDVQVDDEAAELEDLEALKEFGKLLARKNQPIQNEEGIITAATMKNLIKKQAAPQQVSYSDFFQQDFEGEEDPEDEEYIPTGHMTKEEIELQSSAAGRKMLDQDKFKRMKAQNALRSGGGSFRR